jgi:hypothetical protein
MTPQSPETPKTLLLGAKENGRREEEKEEKKTKGGDKRLGKLGEKITEHRPSQCQWP